MAGADHVPSGSVDTLAVPTDEATSRSTRMSASGTGPSGPVTVPDSPAPPGPIGTVVVVRLEHPLQPDGGVVDDRARRGRRDRAGIGDPHHTRRATRRQRHERQEQHDAGGDPDGAAPPEAVEVLHAIGSSTTRAGASPPSQRTVTSAAGSIFRDAYGQRHDTAGEIGRRT